MLLRWIPTGGSGRSWPCLFSCSASCLPRFPSLQVLPDGSKSPVMMRSACSPRRMARTRPSMIELVRTLRQRDLFLLFIGSVIGSGIFRTPGPILRQVGGSVGVALLVWIAGGALSLLGALTYAELAASKPEAGGLYCYIRDGFGRAPAFLYGWCLFLVIASGSVAALARAFSEYFARVIPVSQTTQTIIAVVVIAIVTAVNVWGTRKSSDLQNWTTLIKAGVIVILSAVLLSLGHHAKEVLPAMGVTQHDASLFSSFGLAMIAVLWAYEGWQFGTYSAG